MSALKEKEAYLAMFSFLEQHYLRTKDDGIAALLSDLSLLSDGSPADPAVVADWHEALAKAKEGRVNAGLSVSK